MYGSDSYLMDTPLNKVCIQRPSFPDYIGKYDVRKFKAVLLDSSLESQYIPQTFTKTLFLPLQIERLTRVYNPGGLQDVVITNTYLENLSTVDALGSKNLINSLTYSKKIYPETLQSSIYLEVPSQYDKIKIIFSNIDGKMSVNGRGIIEVINYGNGIIYIME